MTSTEFARQAQCLVKAIDSGIAQEYPSSDEDQWGLNTHSSRHILGSSYVPHNTPQSRQYSPTT